MYMQFQFFTNHVIVFIGRCTSFLTYKLRTRKESVGYEKYIPTENIIYYELRNQDKIQIFFHNSVQMSIRNISSSKSWATKQIVHICVPNCAVQNHKQYRHKS